jgi:hypothetical protein
MDASLLAFISSPANMAGMSGTHFHGLVNTAGKNRVGSMVLMLASCGFAFAAVADPLPACLPPVDIANAPVAAAESNGVLILQGRRAVKIEGLLWPVESGPPSALQEQATATLRRLVGEQVSLRALAPKLDRYGRLRAQVVLRNGKWLEDELLRRGLARVQVAPDRPECARELYAAESQARTARAGLWALPQYAIRTPQSLRWRDLGTFQIVEGTVLNAKVSSGRAYLNFGRNWRTDFTVTISPEDMKAFRRSGVDPYGYAGKPIRVRGYIDRLHGFEIEIGSPAAIEVLSGQ